MKSNTSKRRQMSLFNQGVNLYAAIPKMDEERLAKLITAYQGKLPVTPITFVAYGVQIELGGKLYFLGEFAGKLKPTFALKVYVGFGVGTEVGPFEAYALIAFGPVWIYDGTAWKVGGFILFEAAFSIELAKAPRRHSPPWAN